MSDTNWPIQPQTLVIIVCIVGVFAAAVIYAARSNARRSAMMQEYALSQGWSFSLTDTQGLSAKVDALFPDEQFRLDNIMTIETGRRALYLFDCGYHYRERRSGSMYGTGCLLESNRFGSLADRVEIVERTWINAATLGGQIDLGDSEFSRGFIVIAQDRVVAERAVTNALQTVLAARRQAPLFNPVRIAISSAGVVVLTGMNAEPERWADLAELARAVEASLP